MSGCKIRCNFQRRAGPGRAGPRRLLPVCMPRMSGLRRGWIDDDVNQYLQILWTETFWDGIKRDSCCSQSSKISDLRSSHKYRPGHFAPGTDGFPLGAPSRWTSGRVERSNPFCQESHSVWKTPLRWDASHRPGRCVCGSADAAGHVLMAETNYCSLQTERKYNIQLP